MKKQHFLLTFALLFGAFIFDACKKDHDHDDDLTGVGDVEIEFDHRAGTDALVFGSEYTNAAGEKLKFTTFNYFVSNIVLIKGDGTEFVVPRNDSYFLVKHDEPSTRAIKLSNVPAGDYSKLRFTIGVDSLKSVSDISERQGVLDPAGAANGMYWSWNSGYIFVKVEGTSPAAPIEPGSGERIFQYHTGLYGGFTTPTLNNLKTVTLDIPHGDVAKVRKGHHSPHFHLFVDILEMFKNPTNISVASNPTSHGGPFSKTVADNYADMFSIDHVHN
ncbi:MAG: hypothetical protein KF734_21335 [Saprospiraceae bacterium]|nr:hypothetical protein [Saprospiraceae bacterium]